MRGSVHRGDIARRFTSIFLALMLVLQTATPPTSSLAAANPSLETSSSASAETSQVAQAPTQAPAPSATLQPNSLLALMVGAPGPTGDPLDAPTYGQISLVHFTGLANAMMGGMAVDSAGAVWSWGYNLYGEQGMGGTIPPGNYNGGMKRIPYFTTNGIKIVEIGASYETRWALSSDGTVYAWGQGSVGEMGNGTNTGTNYTPAPVPGLPPIAHIYPSDAYLGNGGCFALAQDGTLWAWGANRGGQLGLGTTANVNTPQQVPLPTDFTNGTRHIVKVALGNSSAFIVDDKGDLWTTGRDANGQQGNGSTNVSNTTFTIMDRTLTGMGLVVDVDASNSTGSSSDHVLAADADGNAWEWGTCYPDNGAAAALATKQTPTKIIVDPTEAATYGYQPLAVSVTATERTGTFIDQHGRPWSWGTGYYFGLGREGGYTGYTAGNIGSNAQTINSTAALQMPKIVGDGDTQVNNTSPKLPIYKGGTIMPDQYGGYGFNSLHPTIYDEKYMLHDSNGNVMDTAGNTIKLVRAATVDGVSGLTPGLYYETTASGTVASPAVVGTPAIDPIENLWIKLAFQPVPYITEYDATLSEYAFLDANGNIFKWGNDGSGAIAWGWDYNTNYDQNGNLTNGLYDRYCYEVMYMRGAPSIDIPSLDIGQAPDVKVYANPTTKQASDNNATVDVHIPATVGNAALGADVHSGVTSLQYIIVPYDTSDSTFNQDVSTLTNDEFQALYSAAPSNLKGDLLADSGPVMSGATAQDLTYNVNIPVNGRLIVWETTDRYADGANGSKDYENIDYAGTAVTADNVYTPTEIQHTGVGTDLSGTTTTLYAPTNANVVKTNDDSTQTQQTFDPSLYGTPLDANGQVIADPTFGYDTVDIKSYEAVGNVGLPAGIVPYWKFSQPQAEVVTKTLNDATVAATGFIQPFDYEPDLNYWTDVSGAKTWNDSDNAAGMRPSSITLTLNQYARDPVTGAKGAFITSLGTTTVTPDGTGNWKFDFGYLKSYEYTYEVVETPVPGYVTTILYPYLVVGPTTNEDLSGISIVNTAVQHDLTKTVSDPTNPDGKYHTGDTLTYTITALNKSDPSDTWSNVTVTDNLPAGLQLVNVTGGTNTGSGNNVVVSLGDIVGGTSKVITVIATVLPGAAGTTITNVAVADNITPPPNKTDITPIHTMTKTVSDPTNPDGKYHAGDTLTYTLVADNQSDPTDIWKGVVITDTLPAGLSLVSVSGGTNTGTGNNVSVAVGDISGGASKTITVTVKVADAAAGTTIKNIAVATSDNDDPIPSPEVDTYINKNPPLPVMALPKTGDVFTVELPLMMLAGALLFFLLVFARRRREEESGDGIQ